jgi:hypothetical protein
MKNHLKDLNLDDKYRLFMLAGVSHCADGPGADAFGWTRANERVTGKRLADALVRS